MTIAELIEALQQFDPKTRVLVKGYEGGYNDAAVSNITPVALDVHSEWYYGKHENVSETTNLEGKKTVEAIIIKSI